MIRMKNKHSSNVKEKKGGAGLLSLVFSWSIADVLNKDLYKDKVKQIPQSFSSADDYLNSFKLPLVEETRAEFCSGLESLEQAPACEILRLVPSRYYNPPKNLSYNILPKGVTYSKDLSGPYDPESGDVILLTDARPRRVEDLNKPGACFLIALVKKSFDGIYAHWILSSMQIDIDRRPNKHKKLFGTYLMNLTTNMRIWEALEGDPPGWSLIQKVLQYDSCEENDCSVCLSKEKIGMSDLLSSFMLDESQKTAILSSISRRRCYHNGSKVKIIWGPPGTGKTKTVASLLYALLKSKCRTLTCAPTNIAVLQVAKRLMSLVYGSLEHDTYGLGDIVLLGNGERMKIDDHDDLVDVFLDYRLQLLNGSVGGWKTSLQMMISLLKEPEQQYNEYVKRATEESEEAMEESEEATEDKMINDWKRKNKNNGLEQKEGGKGANETMKVKKDFDGKTQHESNGLEKKEGGKDVNGKGLKKIRQKQWKEVINQSLKETEIKNKNEEKRRRQARSAEQDGKHSSQISEHCSNGEEVKFEVQLLTFEIFVERKFYSLGDRLMSCAKNLYTHLPTSCIPLGVAKQMIKLCNQLKHLLSARKIYKQFIELKTRREKLLAILILLQEQFPGHNYEATMWDLCLSEACLIFCTASSSIKVKFPMEMVIIDEAAQLKECESTIPLQVPGLRNAVLVGDDRQLPAMVQSKVLENMDFGRSLFQRLASLGKPKHLLNIQYRMHPSISLFPNNAFYENRILDGENVKEASHCKKFLEGAMYGSYSFIDAAGKENFQRGHSPSNLEEAYVIDRIVAKLFKRHRITKQKVSIGVISPYKGQVSLIKEKLGKRYANNNESGFSVSVRSVDGFQGGEEDVIIISTVRCNRNGSVGFLRNHQRTNVALTRARYCLWIVGSASTLANSGTVWKDLVIDAKERGCFYNKEEDATHIDLRRDFSFLKLGKAKWRIFFNDDFRNSIADIKNSKSQIQVKEMLEKLADGWRQPTSKEQVDVANYPVAAELLEQYKVNQQLCLAWTVDIQKVQSTYTQVVKVWDILPASKILKLAKDLDVLFGTCTVNYINRCKHKSFEGNLVVPMSWPCRSAHSALLASDPAESLSRQLAAVSLRDD